MNVAYKCAKANKKFLWLVLFPVLFGVLFSLSSTVYAQTSISLFPIKFRIQIEAGDVFSDTVTVINPGNEAIGVQAEIENLVGGEEGAIDLSVAEVPYGLSAWISIDKSVFVLQPQERRQIPFSVQVPNNAVPAGYFGAILFRTVAVPGEAEAAGTVGISGRVGSVILVEVPGEGVQAGEITEFSGPKYLSRGPAEFILMVKNTGNSHFDPEGIVTVEGMFIKSRELSFEPRVIFPGFSRTFSVEWPFRYAFGPVTATAKVNIPGSGMQIETFSMFIFPWQETGVVVVVILVLWFGLRKLKKSFKLVRVKK